MPKEMLTAIIDCPLCEKEFKTHSVYEQIKCPHCGAEITPLPQGDDYRNDPRHFV